MDKVIWMNNAFSQALRDEIKKNIKELEYYKTVDKPHNSATECFFCKKCKTGIVFPLITAQ
jgi:hypothetical protein